MIDEYSYITSTVYTLLFEAECRKVKLIFSPDIAKCLIVDTLAVGTFIRNMCIQIFAKMDVNCVSGRN